MNKFNLREWVGKGSKNLLKEEAESSSLPTVKEITYKLITELFVNEHVHSSINIDIPTAGAMDRFGKSSHGEDIYYEILRLTGYDKVLDGIDVGDIMDDNHDYIKIVEEISAAFYQKMLTTLISSGEEDADVTLPIDFKIVRGDAPGIKDLSAEAIAEKFGISVELLVEYNPNTEFFTNRHNSESDTKDFHAFLRDMLMGVQNGVSIAEVQLNNFLAAIEKTSGETVEFKYDSSASLPEEVDRFWELVSSKVSLVNVEPQSIIPYDSSGEAVYHIVIPYLIKPHFHAESNIAVPPYGHKVSGEFEVDGFSFYYEPHKGVRLNFDRDNLTAGEVELIKSILSKRSSSQEKQAIAQNDRDDAGEESPEDTQSPDDVTPESDPLADFAQDAVADLFH